jgi:hypothetical protein
MDENGEIKLTLRSNMEYLDSKLIKYDRGEFPLNSPELVMQTPIDYKYDVW